MTIKLLFVMFLGLAAGLAVGSGYVAFLAVLGIIPRLMQLSKTMGMLVAYEWAVILGAVAGSVGSLWNYSLSFPAFAAIPVGAACGIFVGMMAAALTEVLNVFPILAKRIGVDDKIIILMMAFVLGKIAGSLFHWLYFDGGPSF